MRSFRRDTSYAFGANVVLLLVSLATGVLTARWLGPAGRGEFYLVLQFAALAGLLLSFGLGPAYQYHLRKGDYTPAAVVAHILVQLALLAAALGAACWLAMPLLRYATAAQLPDRLLIAAAALTFLTVASLYFGSSAMGLDGGVRFNSVVNAVAGVAYVLLLGGVLLLLGGSVLGALLAFGVSLLIRALAPVILLLRHAREPLGPLPRGMSGALFAYGFGSLLGNVMLSSVLRIDTFLVNAYAGPAAVGVYSIAVAVGELLLMLPAAAGVALFPHLTAQPDDDQVRLAARVARLSVLLSAAAAAVIAAAGYPLIWLLYGGRYLAAFVALLWLLPGLVAMTTVYAYANLYSGRGRPMVNAALFGLGTAVNVALNLLLIPRYGIDGAAAASSLSYLLIAAGFVLAVRREARVPLRSLWLARRDDLDGLLARLPAPLRRAAAQKAVV